MCRFVRFRQHPALLCVPQRRLGVHAVQNRPGPRGRLRARERALLPRRQGSIHAVPSGAEGELQLRFLDLVWVSVLF